MSAISILYEKTVAQVLTPDGEIEFFEVVAGVLQGDTLAPFLFIIALDYALRIAMKEQTFGFTLEERQSARKPAKYLTDANFADDIALISNYNHEAQILLQRLEAAGSSIGLHINHAKTEYMRFNQVEADIVTMNKKKIKQVKDFKYLGSWIATSKKDMEVRIGLAWKALNKMRTVWKSNLKRSLKVQFFRAIVESVLLYGSETWTLTKAMGKRLNGAYTRMLRVALGHTWQEHLKNGELYGKLKKVTSELLQRRLRFIGHMWRRREEIISDVLLWEPKEGRRRQGRPALTYVDQLRSDTQLTIDELRFLMSQRDDWRKLIQIVRGNSN